MIVGVVWAGVEVETPALATAVVMVRCSRHYPPPAVGDIGSADDSSSNPMKVTPT
jgi:hypothetical protein